MNVATVSLSAPLTGAKLRDAGVRAHLFSSVGGLHAMRTLRGEAGTSAEVAAAREPNRSLTPTLNPNPNPNPSPSPSPNPNPNPNQVAANLMRGTRVCVGAGLLVPTPMGRMELSLTKVLDGIDR